MHGRSHPATIAQRARKKAKSNVNCITGALHPLGIKSCCYKVIVSSLRVLALYRVSQKVTFRSFKIFDISSLASWATLGRVGHAPLFSNAHQSAYPHIPHMCGNLRIYARIYKVGATWCNRIANPILGPLSRSGPPGLFWAL